MKLKLVLILFLCICISSFAQKPNKIKVKAYYNNIPRRSLDNQGYNYTHAKGISNSFDKLSENEIKLELKGYPNGDDLSLIFYSNEPALMKTIREETVLVNTAPATKYTPALEARGDTKVFLLNKNKEPLLFFNAAPDYTWIDYTDFPKWSYEEAQKALDFNSFVTNNCRERYISESLKACQKELDNKFGICVLQTKLNIYSLKAKKFDYTDFNDATLKFEQTVSDSNLSINSAGSKATIANTIAIWKQYEAEYQPGKKTKVCDVNIDKIYQNILTGYMILGDPENLKIYWDKFVTFFKKPEHAATYFSTAAQMIENNEYFLAHKDKPLTPIDINGLISETTIYNDMVFFQGVFNTYLSSLTNLLYVSDFFPANKTLLSQAERVITDKVDNITHYLNYEYTSFGRLSKLSYRIDFEDESGIDKDELKQYGLVTGDTIFNFNFIYDKDSLLEKVTVQDNRTLFEIRHSNKDVISGISFYNMINRAVTYGFEPPVEGKISINMALINRAKKEVLKREKYYFNYVDNKITKIALAPYTSIRHIKTMEDEKTVFKNIPMKPLITYGIDYDENNNLKTFQYTDFEGHPVVQILSNKVDEHGNVTESDNSQTSYKYLY